MTITVTRYANGNAANNPGCGKGPLTLRASPFIESLHLPLKWQPEISTDDQSRGLAAIDTVCELNQQLAKIVFNSVQSQQKFLTLGGDHSCAIGTWSGAASALGADESLGLIWLDAHMDSHTFETTPSNNIHGMPLAALLGYGEPAITQIQMDKPKLNPEHLVLIGIRSYEPGEAELLKKLNVKIYFIEEIIERGLQPIIEEAIAIVTAHTKGFGISVDLDGFDPKQAPAVGAPAENGLSPAEFLTHLPIIAQNPDFIGAEIAEFNPSLDVNHKTEKLVADIIQQLFA